MPLFKKLIVSNRAWESTPADKVLPVLAEHGVQGIEVAPTAVWPNWKGATVEAASEFAENLRDQGFSVPALQDILAGREDLHLFGSAQQITGLKTHIEFVAELAQAMGAKIIVLGAPQNRLRGSVASDRARHIAVEFFMHLGNTCAKKGVCLCIEPNPVQYGCDFITNSGDAMELVNIVDSPGFGIQLDTASMHLADESIYSSIVAAGERLRHIHVSEPNLQDFANPVCDHLAAATALKEINYEGWVNIEMRKSDQPLESVKKACEFVLERYFDVQPSRC